MTLNNVIKKIRLIAESHKLITSYYFGDVLDYTVKTEQQHSSMVCTLTGATVTRTQSQVKFGLYFFDWCELDNIDKETEIWSDQLLILQDVIAEIRDKKYDWDVSESNNVTFFEERYEDAVSGVQTDITITFDYEADRCAVPNI